MSSTIAEIVARPHRDVGYVLFIEGLPYAFTNRSELAGSGVGSWISGAPGGDRVVIEGLQVPETISYASSLEDGMLSSEDGGSFEIVDFENKLIELVAESEGDVVGETFGPKTTPAPALLLDGVTPVWGRWLNHEAIGPAGERRYYPCMPVDLPGYDHAAVTSEAQTLALSILRDAPTWHEGLRCAFYVIYFDQTSNYIPNWITHHNSGYSLVWFGSTRELTCEGLTWTLDCDGPTSWLRKQLGATRSAEWLPVSTVLKLSTEPGAREDLSAYYFSYRTTTLWERGASSYYSASDVLTGATAADLRTQIQSRLNTVAATAGPDTTWSTARNASCTFSSGKIAMQVDNFGYAAYAYVCFHENVWRVLGYDPLIQAGVDPADDPLIVDFVKPNDLAFELAPFSNVPGPGYWLARLSTIPKQYPSLAQAGSDADNDGKPRVYYAIMGDDVSTIYPAGGQELDVGLANGLPYFEPQTCRPPEQHTLTNSGGDVDATAFIALRGSYLTSADEEPITMVQVAKVGFKDDTSGGGHGPSPDADSNLKCHLETFLDARYFGIDRKLSGPWSSLDLEFCPVNLVGYNLNFGERADLILLRTMLSTGTASWTGYEGQGATISFGDNAHPDAAAPQGSDVEIADLGLAIPYTLIDADSFVKTAAKLPEGGVDSMLNRCKFAYIGPFDSQDLLWRIVEQRGWGMGLVKGQFRLFSRADLLDAEDVEVTLTTDDIVGEQDFVEVADLRPVLPRDAFEIEYGKSLVEDAGSDMDLRAVAIATDSQSRSRRTNNREIINGAGLVPSRLWRNDPAPEPWIPAWSQLVAHELAAFYASPWVAVEVPVHWSKAREIGVGSVVKLTTNYAPSRDGTYGITGRVGRVIGWSLRTAELVVDLRVLVQAGDPSTKPRRFGPVAQVLESVTTVEARHDAAARTFKCYADAFGHGEPTSDVTGFGEPNYSATGTEAIVYGYQHNGRAWAKTFEFTVESVDSAAHTITWKAGTFSGTWWEARPTTLLLAPYDDQPGDSWTRAVYAVITRSDGYFGAGPTKGVKLV